MKFLGSSSKPKKEFVEVQVGDEAPDFELGNVDGKKFRLSSFRGRRVLLSFHRYAA